MKMPRGLWVVWSAGLSAGSVPPPEATKGMTGAEVAYLVLMAGTGLTDSDMLTLQSHLILKVLGLAEERSKSEAKTLKRLKAVAVAEKDEEPATSMTGASSEYGTIEETMAPSALQTIGDWILEQVGTKPRL